MFVGILNTIVGNGTFALLVLVDVNYVISSVIGQVLGVTNSYFWNKYFTFRAAGKSRGEVMRFIGVYTVHYFVSLSGLVFLVEVAKLHPLVAQGLVVLATTVISFFGHKYWTFKNT